MAICRNKTKRMIHTTIAIQEGKTSRKMVYIETSLVTDVFLTPLFFIFDGVRWNPQETIDLFQVKPPFIFGFRIPISKEIIPPNG